MAHHISVPLLTLASHCRTLSFDASGVSQLAATPMQEGCHRSGHAQSPEALHSTLCLQGTFVTAKSALNRMLLNAAKSVGAVHSPFTLDDQ